MKIIGVATMQNIRRGLIIGTLAAAASLIPACTNKTEKEHAAETMTREVADIAFPLIASSIGGLPATADDKEVLASDNPVVYAVVQARDRVGHQIYFSQAASIEIGGKRIQEPFTDGWEMPVFKWDESRYGPIEIEWSEVVAESGFYNNTVPSQSKIRYKEKPAGAGWSIKPSSGTHRYKLRVRYFRNEISDRQKTMTENDGQIRGVHRVTVRDGDDLPGWMTAWMNLPYIYGSTPEQVEELIGGDCADVITGALHKLGKDVPYTYSQGFRPYGDVIFSGYLNMRGEFLDATKKRPEALDIRRGDLLVYKQPQHHVAVFASDLQRNGFPIEVVHTYDGKGVHKTELYSSQVSDGVYGFQRNLLKLFGLEKQPAVAAEPTNNRLDRVE